MEYISTSQAAKLWQISTQRITILAKDGRIPGAVQVGKRWLIPQNANKPADGRTKSAKEDSALDDSFRFPLLINKEENDFIPKLSKEEQQLRFGQKQFYACDFIDSEKEMESLLASSVNPCIRITALYYLCCISAYKLDLPAFEKYFELFSKLLSTDFPHKNDMQAWRFQLCLDSGYNYKYILDNFKISSTENIHPSAYSLMFIYSIISQADGDFSMYSRLRFENYEIACMRMEEHGFFFEAQELHYFLLEFYQMKSNEEMMLYHLRCGLKIAYDHKLYYWAAAHVYYYPEITKKVLKEFPNDFADTMNELGQTLHEKYVAFTARKNTTPYLGILSDKEIKLATFAVQNISNQEVAKHLNISEKTVSKRYTVIYEKLGVKNKKELADLIIRSQKTGEI